MQTIEPPPVLTFPSSPDLNHVTTLTPSTLPPRYIFKRDPNNPHDLILTIDNSSLEGFSTCARYGQLKLIRSRERPTGPAINAGKCMHNAIEVMYKTNFDEKALGYILSSTEQFYLSNPVPDGEWRTLSMVTDAIMKYWHHYRNIDQGDFTILETESSFSVPLCSIEFNSIIPVLARNLLGEDNDEPTVAVHTIHVYWSGRVDLIVESKTYNGEMFSDHKTTSMLGSTFYDDFQMAAQTVGYHWATKPKRPKLKGFILNVIAWRKPTKSGTPLEFQRMPYYYSEFRLAEWYKDTVHQINDFLAHLQRNYFPKQTKWCVGKYGKCQYFDVCSAQNEEEREFVLQSDMFSNVSWTPFNADTQP